MTRQARPDLRARMQKVASKPAQHPDTQPRSRTGTSRGTRAGTSQSRRAAAPRGGGAAKARSAARTETPRRARAATPPSAPATIDLETEEYVEPEADGTTRLETLSGWFMWEMVSVPRRRLRYLKELLLGG